MWLFRSNTPTRYRVGNATTLQGEILEAGLPEWTYNILRIFKPMIAFMLIIGVLYNPLTLPSIICTTILMVGAIGMHVYAKDNIIKTLPAIILFVFCLLILQQLL